MLGTVSINTWGSYLLGLSAQEGNGVPLIWLTETIAPERSIDIEKCSSTGGGAQTQLLRDAQLLHRRVPLADLGEEGARSL